MQFVSKMSPVMYDNTLLLNKHFFHSKKNTFWLFLYMAATVSKSIAALSI